MKILFLLPFILFTLSFEKTPKIEKGDLVCECIIESVQIKESISTIEPEPIYIYQTNCKTVLSTNNGDIYHVGDTITYVYKKR